jgi:hypothetical protein
MTTDKAVKEIQVMLIEQWQEGMVSGREMISMAVQKIAVESPETMMTITEVSALIDGCIFPFEHSGNE